MLYWTDSHTEMDFANQRPSQFVLARSHYIVKSQRNYSYLEAVTVCCGQKLLQYEVTEKLLITTNTVNKIYGDKSSYLISFRKLER